MEGQGGTNLYKSSKAFNVEEELIRRGHYNINYFRYSNKNSAQNLNIIVFQLSYLEGQQWYRH